MDIVADLPHRQPIHGLPAGPCVEQQGPVELFRIEQVRKVADGVRKIHQPIIERPPWDIDYKPEAERDVGRPPSLEGRLDVGWLLLQGDEGDLDLLAGLLLESRDHLLERLVLLSMVRLVPPHDEVGRLCARAAPGRSLRQERWLERAWWCLTLGAWLAWQLIWRRQR
jgi:hypothetical protein